MIEVRVVVVGAIRTQAADRVVAEVHRDDRVGFLCLLVVQWVGSRPDRHRVQLILGETSRGNPRLVLQREVEHPARVLSHQPMRHRDGRAVPDEMIDQRGQQRGRGIAIGLVGASVGHGDAVAGSDKSLADVGVVDRQPRGCCLEQLLGELSPDPPERFGRGHGGRGRCWSDTN